MSRHPFSRTSARAISFTLRAGVLSALAALAVAASSVRDAHAQSGDVDPTHYWSWTVQTADWSNALSEFRDPFLPEYLPLIVYKLHKAWSPVVKVHGSEQTPITDPALSYTWWSFANVPEFGDETVTIYDQFNPGGALITADSLAFVMVPARMDSTPAFGPPPGPGEANHYLCYRAQGPVAGETVGVSDRFRSDPTVPLSDARYLCAPCWKKHDGVEYAPRDSTWLVLYRMTSPSPARNVWMRDQFTQGSHPYMVTQSLDEYLAVPARAERSRTSVDELESGRTASWGSVKSLYR